MKKSTIWIFGIIFIFLAYVATALIYEMLETKKERAELLAKQKRHNEAVQGLYSSKLFGIQIKQQADLLLFSLQDIGASYGNIDKVFEDTELLKNTEKFFLTGSGYSVKLNDFINDVGIEETRQRCLDLKEISNNTEASCLRPINKNDDFSEYYIKYHPYGYKIWSIIGKLNKNSYNKKECIQNLKPYANILFNKIREKNSNERIIVIDKFYPNEKFPIISFDYKSEFDNRTPTILTIEGHCQNNSSYISLNAPLLKPRFEVFTEIEEKIKEKKKLNIKNNFDKEVKEQEKSIDTQGLQ